MILFWVFVLALSALLYVLLDGFDLGVGILFGLARNEGQRRMMLSAVGPLWDGNETWLVVIGVVLWGAFPPVYAILLSAFYMPLLLMLTGLILRGVSFEYRNKTQRLRWLWDFCFAAGSLVAGFCQGVTVGALVEGLPVVNGRFVGSGAEWLSPFALLCGVGLCVGYSLLGACWLINKCEGEDRERGYRQARWLGLAISVFLLVVFVWALADNLQVMRLWLARPYLLVFPAIGLGASLLFAYGVRARRDNVPFYMVALIFAAAFATLAISFWPYMIPFSITVYQAASPHESLAFMFWGEGLFVFPLMLLYTAFAYRIFHGKARPASEGYG